MHKVLITTYITTTYGCAVATTVVDCASQSQASEVAFKINGIQQLGNVLYRQAEILS